jgi:predicted ArsR family transcriptional regulator
MKTSRQEVFDYIRARRVVTTGELSRDMQMTTANARHHVKLLEAQGLVAVVGQRSRQGKGRPENLYGLSEQMLGNNLAYLSSVLLAEALNNLTPADRLALLDQLAIGMLASALAEIHPGSDLPPTGSPPRGAHLTQRLYQAVKLLESLHYQARWEAHALAPRITFGHCPYLLILDQHPELCQFDAILLVRFTGVPVDLLERRRPDRRGLRQCVFALRG